MSKLKSLAFIWMLGAMSFLANAQSECSKVLKKAEKLYDNFILELKRKGIKCKGGTFGAQMELKLNNDGPFTLILSSNK